MKQKIINAYTVIIDNIISGLMKHNNRVKIRFVDKERQRKAKNKMIDLCKHPPLNTFGYMDDSE